MEYDSTCNRAFESACVKAWRPNLPPALPQPPSITIPHNHKHKHNPPQRTPTNPSTHFYSNHPHPAGMLRGPFHTPANHTAQTCLSALLTHSLAARLAEGDPRPLLVCLNSSMETAQVIWNSSMREELTKVGGACNSSFQGLVLGGTEQGLRK